MTYRTRFGDRLANQLVRHFPSEMIKVPEDACVVSFTFDDGCSSAVANGAKILADEGARGTFYISGSLCEAGGDSQAFLSGNDLAELRTQGHEIACHTYSHQNVRLLDIDQLAGDLNRNDAFVSTHAPGPRMANFAYPYTYTSMRARKLLLQRFRTCRGGLPGINRGLIDRGHVSAVEIRPSTRAADLHGWLDELGRCGGWLLFFTHDVSNSPSPFGCHSALLRALVAHARSAGYPILTVGGSLAKLGLVQQIDERIARLGAGIESGRSPKPVFRLSGFQ